MIIFIIVFSVIMILTKRKSGTQIPCRESDATQRMNEAHQLDTTTQISYKQIISNLFKKFKSKTTISQSSHQLDHKKRVPANDFFNGGGGVLETTTITAIIALISSALTGFITYLGTKKKADNELNVEVKRIEQNYDLKINELKNKIELKDKDIETMRVQHELDLQTKNADTMNPLLAELMTDFMNDPEGTTKKLEKMQKSANIMNAKFKT